MSAKRAKAVLVACAVLVGAFALLGLGVEERLHRTDLTIEGTGAAAAAKLGDETFGPSAPLAILLEGPPREVDRHGRRIARALDRRPGVAVIGPWSPGVGDALRPAAGRALVLVRIDGPFEEASSEHAPAIRAQLERLERPPVAVHMSGYPDIAAGIHASSVDALRRAELLAAPLLLIVLLLVFRSPIAALLPLGLGLATIGAARGVLELVNRAVELDAVALNLASMMGLALGVDYSLVMVTRYREELARTGDPAAALAVLRPTAGRTVIFAGLTLGLAMVAAVVLAPGSILESAGIGVVTAVVLSVGGASTALPAALRLLGPGIDRWTFGTPGAGGGRWGALAASAMRRPALAAGVVLALIAALSAPALALETAPPDPRNLPESSSQRRDFGRMYAALPGAWIAPYELVVAAPRGPVTTERRLRQLDRFQAALAREPEVHAVLGPAPLSRAARELGPARRALGRTRDELSRARRGQQRLVHGLRRVHDGVGELRAGLAEAGAGAAAITRGGAFAAGGSERLAEGIERARAGARALSDGLAEASAGASAASAGIDRLLAGQRRLAAGLERAAGQTAGALPRVEELRAGLAGGARDLGRLRRPARIAEDELAEALEALDALLPSSRLDPQYERLHRSVATAYAAVSGRDPRDGSRVEEGYDGLERALAEGERRLGEASAGVAELERGLARLAAGLGEARAGAGALVRGLDRLRAGGEELQAGLARLADGGDALARGLPELARGGERLASGSERLAAGAGALARGLDGGAARTAELESGVDRMEQGVVAARSRLDGLAGGAEAIDTRIFDSGYLALAAIDSQPPARRTPATFVLNADRGGSATRIAVIGKGNPTRAGHPLRPLLERAADRLERETGMRAAVGGPAPSLQDFDEETGSRLLPLLIALVVVTYLALVPLLRSLVLPLIAVLLNALTVAAGFGVLAIGFAGNSPLGGTGQLDSISALAMLAIVFGLSIDYEVFMLARMREEWLRSGEAEEAVAIAVRATAAVVTGGALIMVGVFAAFAIQDVVSLRQLGVGLTVAVLLDATVVRLVLLPALVRLAGERAWWLPRWLDRALPRVDVEPPPRLSAAPGEARA